MEPESASAWNAEDDEWELFNDDGFIYKRKKRRRLANDPAAVVDVSKKRDPVVDPEVEEKQRKERKRKALLKLKKKYQREIDQWELLSNTLSEMQEKLTLRCREQREEGERRGVGEETTSVLGPSGVVQRTDDASGSLLDELLLQVIGTFFLNCCLVAEQKLGYQNM